MTIREAFRNLSSLLIVGGVLALHPAALIGCGEVVGGGTCPTVEQLQESAVSEQDVRLFASLFPQQFEAAGEVDRLEFVLSDYTIQEGSEVVFVHQGPKPPGSSLFRAAYALSCADPQRVVNVSAIVSVRRLSSTRGAQPETIVDAIPVTGRLSVEGYEDAPFLWNLDLRSEASGVSLRAYGSDGEATRGPESFVVDFEEGDARWPYLTSAS